MEIHHIDIDGGRASESLIVSDLTVELEGATLRVHNIVYARIFSTLFKCGTTSGAAKQTKPGINVVFCKQIVKLSTHTLIYIIAVIISVRYIVAVIFGVTYIMAVIFAVR